MRVDLPAPFGPSKPMERPRNEAVRLRRISRSPNRTERPWSSTSAGRGTAGGVCSFSPLAVPSCVVVLTEFALPDSSQIPLETSGAGTVLRLGRRMPQSSAEKHLRQERPIIAHG
jgi:hypothetical protein